MGNGELLVIRPDGTTDLIPNTSEAITAGLDGEWLDYLPVRPDLGLYIQEEGLLLGSRLNTPVSLLSSRAVFGPVVLTGGTDEEGNDLPPGPDYVLLARSFGEAWVSVLADAERGGQDLTIVANPDTVPPPQIIDMNDPAFASVEGFERFIREGQTRRG
jgi:hypothetical protein